MRRALLGLCCLFLLLLPGTALAATGDPQDKIVVVGDTTIAPGESVGDLVVIHGDVLIRGTVLGDVVVVDGDVTIRGAVGGDVVTIAKQATLGRRAHVAGDIKWAQDRPIISPGAVVGGKVERFSKPDSFGWSSVAIAVGFWVITSISLLLAGLLLLLLAPRAGDAVVRAARSSTGGSILTGLVLLILLPIIAVVLLVTVVGTPLGIGLLLALVPIYAIAYLATALVLGRRFVKDGGRILAFFVGLLLLRLLALIPFAGALISLIATIFGLGALFIALRRARIA